MPEHPDEGSTPVFAIVTPCFNAAEMIADTVRSVLGQSALRSGRARLRYVICDGASTDDTVARVKAILAEAGDLAADVSVVSEPDRGMYDALANGFAAADAGAADVVAYINAGDYYSPTCFDAVLDAMAVDGSQWLTGMRVLYNHAGQVIDARVPPPYRTRLLRSGHYGYRGKLGALQQESTFWTGRLHRTLDLDRLREFRLAGDFFLWRTFAEHAELDVVYTHLGGFRYHGGHLSADMSSYYGEMRSVLDRATPATWLTATWDLAVLQLPMRLRIHLSGHRMLTWHQPAGHYRRSQFWPIRESVHEEVSA